MGPLPQDLLGDGLVLPKRGVFGAGVQLRQAVLGVIPVKDASVREGATDGFLRR